MRPKVRSNGKAATWSPTPKDRPAGTTSHAGLPAFGEDGAERPAERSSDQADRGPEFAVSHGAGLQLGPHQDEQSKNAQHQARFAAAGNVVVAEQQGIEHQKP